MPVGTKFQVSISPFQALLSAPGGRETFSVVFAYDTGIVRYRTIRNCTVEMDMGYGWMIISL